MTFCKPWMTHTSKKAYFQCGPFKKSISLKLIKLTQKIELKLLQLKYHR